MHGEQLSQLSIGSTLGELPGIEESYELSTRAGVVGELFTRRPDVFGVLITDRGAVTSAVSRRYYLDTVGRYLGQDVFNPRPLATLLRHFHDLGGALVLPGATPIPEAVRLGLARARELVYEPIVVVATQPRTPARLVDFEQLLLADSQMTQLRNGQMRQILASVYEGLLLVERDHRIAAEHSDSVAAIFDTTHVGGRRLEDLLAEGLDEERCQLAADYLDTLFDPRIIELLVVKVNPLLRVTAHLGAKPKVLEFRFSRGGEAGRIDHVLVRVEDVSRREELARELETQRERADQRVALAMGLAHADPAQAAPFLAALEAELRSLAEAAGPGGLDPTTAPERARAVHRLKGEAGLLGLQSFEIALHRLEDGLGRGNAEAPQRLGAALLELDALRRDAAELIGRFRALAATQGAGERRTRRRAAAAAAPARPTDGARADDGWRALSGDLARLAKRVADDLGKRVRVRASFDAAAGLSAGWLPPVRDVAVQLLRNAVAHGIETPAERLRAGKDGEGLVQVALRHHGDTGWLELIVQDDGRGLDGEAIARRARQLGLAAPASGNWAELLFHPGFSTQQEANLHAGRGVGLDAVRAMVAERGGNVQLHGEPGRFCAAQVLLPLAMSLTEAVPA